MNSRCAAPVLLPNPVTHPAAWVAFLRDAGPGLDCRPAIFVSGDAHLELLSAARVEIGKHYDFVIADAATLDLLADKRLQYRWFQEHDVAAPRTLVPHSAEEAQEVAERIGLPCLAKPAFSHRWAAVSKNKVFPVRTRAEAARHYTRMQECQAYLILQEHVEGPDDQFYGVLTYIGRTGQTLAAFTKRKLHQFPEQFGNGSMQISIRDAALQHLAGGIFAKLGYAGFGSLEFKRDARDGRLKLIELNPRTVSGLQMAVDSGCDMPWLAYCDVTGTPVPPVTDFHAGVRFVNIAWELQRVRQTASRSPVRWLRLAADLGRSGSFAELSLRDLGPALSLLKRALR